MDPMDEFKEIYFTECAELLADMEDRLMKLEEGTQDTEALNAIFRCAHSIKGGAGAFGLDAIMHFTHNLEALLDCMRDGRIVPTREGINLLLLAADIVTQMIQLGRAGKTPEPALGSKVLAQIQALTQQGQGGAPAPATSSIASTAAAPTTPAATHGGVYTIHFAPHRGLFASGNEPLHILKELSQLGTLEVVAQTAAIQPLDGFDPTACQLSWDLTLTTTAESDAVHEVFEFVQHICDLTITCTAPATLALAEEPIMVAAPAAAGSMPVTAPVAPANPASGAVAATTSIRVDLEKVDRLVNMVGELVITEAMLRAQSRFLQEDTFAGLIRGIDELSHHTRELQEAVMSMRMQPVKSIFSRMPRIVRDTAAKLGKDIQLILIGENTEVDKTVIEQLSDPLTHMIRNSIDHGIESPDQRVWADKELQGTIQLSAGHRSGRIIIEIKDDGAGINRMRVLDKARERKLVPPEANLTDEEIDQLIFLPGFSTAEKVTDVSGRGVGMDVVRRNIESIGGFVRVTNNPGKGSCFTVSLPLTLAILDGMIVRVGSESYIIPITSIIESLRPKAGEVRRVEGHGDVINVRGGFLPLIYLHSIFGIPEAEQDTDKSLVVIVEYANERMGIVVDELIGQQQVVIKSLEENTDPVRGISGATILGDGKVSLILEMSEMQALANTPRGHSPLLKIA